MFLIFENNEYINLDNVIMITKKDKNTIEILCTNNRIINLNYDNEERTNNNLAEIKDIINKYYGSK